MQTAFTVWMLWMSSFSETKGKALFEKFPISVIICAKNEKKNLEKNLPVILNQDYYSFEVIVVNESDDDEALLLLKEFSEKFQNLKIINITKDQEHILPGKKFALSLGIAAAENENLLFCDADCQPASDQWINLMSNPMMEQKDIIAGYGAYKKCRGWLNTFIRWETIHTFLQYSTYAKSGVPYMAVGRNMACKKSILLKAQAQPIWASMPSGDDDLLVQLMGTRKNVGIVSDKLSFTYSETKETFAEWIKQKQRHLSTGKIYKKTSQFLLGTYALSHGLVWLLWIILWLGGYGYLIMSLMVLRCILVWSLWAIEAKTLNDKGVIIWLPICDIAWAFYNLLFSPYIFFKTKRQWK